MRYFLLMSLMVVLVSPHTVHAQLASAWSPQVLSQPREVKVVGKDFVPSTARVIYLSDNAADRFAARLLQEAVRKTHGIDCKLVSLPQKSPNWHRLWLGSTPTLPDAPPTPHGHEKEGYGLSINSTGALIAAESDAGLFYGVQTLIQLLEQSYREKARIPGIVTSDWPTFDWRARYLEGNQYRESIVISRANLERVMHFIVQV